MKRFEGNAITPIEDYQGKWALSPCGNVVSDDFNGKEGWFIVEPLKPYQFYFNGELSYNLEKLQNDKMEEMKNLSSKFILNKYPQYKQINASIGIYGDEFKNIMINFINSVRNETNKYEQLILNSDYETLINLEFVF